MTTTAEMAADAVREIRKHWEEEARVALVLGTGLGVLADQVRVQAVIPFESLPHFPRATAPSHRGTLVCGHTQGVPVVLLNGRCHLYEGYSIQEVTLPIRVLRSAERRRSSFRTPAAG